MELTLNLVWVCVAIVAILAHIVTLWSNGASLRRPAIQSRKVIAMGCALVILFFVISMTDDLHDQQVLIEERKPLRIAAGTESIARPDSGRSIPIGFLLFFPPPAFSPNMPALRRGIDTSEFPSAGTNTHKDLCGRAPPSSLV